MEYKTFKELAEGLKTLNTNNVETLNQLANVLADIEAPMPEKMMPIETASDGEELTIFIAYEKMTNDNLDMCFMITISVNFVENTLDLSFKKHIFINTYMENNTTIFRNLTPDTISKDLIWALNTVAEYEKDYDLKPKTLTSDELHSINVTVKTEANDQSKQRLRHNLLPLQPVYLYDKGFTDEVIGKVISVKEHDNELIATVEVPNKLWNPYLILDEKNVDYPDSYALLKAGIMEYKPKN